MSARHCPFCAERYSRPSSPMLHARPLEYGTDPVEVNPPAGLDRVDHPDECSTWLVALRRTVDRSFAGGWNDVFVGAVVGLTVLYLAVHVVVAFFRLVAS